MVEHAAGCKIKDAPFSDRVRVSRRIFPAPQVEGFACQNRHTVRMRGGVSWASIRVWEHTWEQQRSKTVSTSETLHCALFLPRHATEPSHPIGPSRRRKAPPST